jgi:hypothetical protein
MLIDRDYVNNEPSERGIIAPIFRSLIVFKREARIALLLKTSNTRALHRHV